MPKKISKKPVQMRRVIAISNERYEEMILVDLERANPGNDELLQILKNIRQMDDGLNMINILYNSDSDEEFDASKLMVSDGGKQKKKEPKEEDWVSIPHDKLYPKKPAENMLLLPDQEG